MAYYFYDYPERSFDVECYRNYFLVKFLDFASGRVAHVAMHADTYLNTEELRRLMTTSKLFGFNSRGYDMLMIRLAMTGATCDDLKEASDLIIQKKTRARDFENIYGLRREWQEFPNMDHVDLMEVAPGVGVSLKMYAGRMGYKRMQDLPYDPSAILTGAMKAAVSTYCDNDLGVTMEMRNQLRERLEMRETLSARYNVDLRSKSDAQMAESVLRASLDFKPDERVVPHGYRFKYDVPENVQFVTPTMQAVLQTVRDAEFVVYDTDQLRAEDYDDETGEAEDGATRAETPKGVVFKDKDGATIKSGVKLPESIKGTVIQFGHSQYKLGIGGLHSQEDKSSHFTIPGKWTISDHDVVSYYPSLILGRGMYPAQIGPVFLTIYGNAKEERLAAKAAGQETLQQGLKIFLNGTFGKLFSKYFVGYAPELGIAVTLTGQLYLLMLIERLELAGISVVSANTDGIVIRTPVGREWMRDQILSWWEKQTKLETEASFYDAIYMCNVNNYFAVVTGSGKVKRKGLFAKYGMLNNKHPDMQVSADAVIDYLTRGVPMEQTVRECTNLQDFIVVRQVRGGGAIASADDLEVMQQHKKAVSKARARDKKANPNLQRDERGPEQTAAIKEREEYVRSFYHENYLGKAVRWYHGVGGGWISTPAGGVVGGSTGATPCMDLPDEFPRDIDYDHYVAEGRKLLIALGLVQPPPKTTRKQKAPA